MNVSKDILRLLIEEYFHDETIYSCQFVSKFVNSCIIESRRYSAQCEKIAVNMRKKQNEYFMKKRKQCIDLAVNEKLKHFKGRRIFTMKKLLTSKYSKQEGNPYCDYCSYIASPKEISVHVIKHADYHIEKRTICNECNCVNPQEKDSPHCKDGCPLREYTCFLGNLAPTKFHKYHCRCSIF